MFIFYSIVKSMGNTLRQITTGNWIFAECVEVCRVAKLGHSAKSHFAERQTQHSAKDDLPSA